MSDPKPRPAPPPVRYEMEGARHSEITRLRAELHAWDERWMRVQSDLQDAHQQVERLREALRDACIGHADECVCAGCALAFRSAALEGGGR